MTRKRYICLLMASGYQRNEAQRKAKRVYSKGHVYADEYAKLVQCTYLAHSLNLQRGLFEGLADAYGNLVTGIRDFSGPVVQAYAEAIRGVCSKPFVEPREDWPCIRQES